MLVLWRVFVRPRYILLAVLAGGGLLLTLSLVPQRALVWSALSSDALSLSEKGSFLAVIFTTFGGNMSVLSMLLAGLLAVMFGVQSALLLYYIRRRKRGTKGGVRTGVTTLSGTIAALFGIGCAACGSVIVTALLGLFGATGLLALLPLHGLEFGLLGVVLLGVSVWYLLRRIADPLVCAVDYEPRP